MQEGVHALSDREHEVLRMLLKGHDAKSIAQTLGLSVHTVNERLRESRRKLGATSSREAARMVAEAEAAEPKFFGTPKLFVAKKIGVSPAGGPPQTSGQEQGAGNAALVKMGGGVLVMSLLAALLFSNMLAAGDPVGGGAADDSQNAMDVMPIADADRDGRVTPEEYRAFSEQGWGFVARDKESVKLSELDQAAQVAFFGIRPADGGVITHEMYLDAIPVRFRMFDQNGDNVLSADEINGRVFQARSPQA